ncbi:MAG: Glutarate-semialdehyde dehydrogenase DavD [Acidimicrobiales bacterium]|nr:MAG: aldehyde dehydrogenase [Actinomycetota bacterium]MBV6509377.1 Glutarate-semialdehyde dehydrogenase DavD [Acidimicrobiales bacterium]RIK04589.1 MAG: aldehyde dehydrogenase [Acidobacteriota bacterium]
MHELEVTSPATGEKVGVVSAADADDVRAAIGAARHGAEAMEEMAPFERAERLHVVADLIEEQAEELARQLTMESGKPIGEATDEVAESADIFRWAAEEAKRLETPALPGADPNKVVLTFRKPNGVYALITPWNFPMNIPAELVAPALAGGNAAILKPSELTPLSGMALVAAAQEAGFPEGAATVLNGGGEVGRALVEHEAVDAVGFVGSHQTAEAIVRAAGLKRTLIEASGNGPQIVCDDADLEAAAAAAVYGASFASGQCCVATERLLVQESVHGELVPLLLEEAQRAVLGDPLEAATSIGPLNNEAVALKMERHLADAVERGGEILVGGARAGGFPTPLYWPLTVVDGVTPEMLLFREESFGPVLPITTFTDDEEAIDLANDSDLGLQSAVFTSSLKRAFRYVNRLRAGSIVVNDSTDFWEPHPPFGGASRTRTGWGRIGGKYTLLDMTDLRTAIIDVEKTDD